MFILEPIATAQTVKFIPRELECDSVLIHDETQNKDAPQPFSASVEDYYLTGDIIYDFENNRFYVAIFYNGTDVVYRSRIFVTDQPIGSYSINDGEYKEKETTNEFIVIQ